MSDSPLYRTVYPLLTPSWLNRGDGGKVLGTIGLLCDATAEHARQGLRARFPSLAPESALPFIGRDRRIARGIDEPSASYRERLLTWLDDHATRGGPFAMMDQLAAYCQVPVRIRVVDRRGNWWTREYDGSREWLIDQQNWNWDALPLTDWSRFWVIIYSAFGPWGTLATIGGNPAPVGEPEFTVGTTATVAEAASVRSIVREWRPEGSRCEWIILAFDDNSFDPTSPEPDGQWGLWGKDDGSGNYVPSRLATARYWRDTA